MDRARGTAPAAHGRARVESRDSADMAALLMKPSHAAQLGLETVVLLAGIQHRDADAVLAESRGADVALAQGLGQRRFASASGFLRFRRRQPGEGDGAAAAWKVRPKSSVARSSRSVLASVSRRNEFNRVGSREEAAKGVVASMNPPSAAPSSRTSSLVGIRSFTVRSCRSLRFTSTNETPDVTYSRLRTL